MNAPVKVSLLAIAFIFCATVAQSDAVFDYALNDVANGLTFTWTLTGVPDTPPILPQFSSQVGQLGDVMVTVNGVTEPDSMILTANSLIFQCDPTELYGWDTAAAMNFDTPANAPLLNGSQLLTGNFVGEAVGVWGAEGNLQLSVTDPQDTPEPPTGSLLIVAIAAILFAKRHLVHRATASFR